LLLQVGDVQFLHFFHPFLVSSFHHFRLRRMSPVGCSRWCPPVWRTPGRQCRSSIQMVCWYRWSNHALYPLVN
jgi:hypothetical protein